MERIQTLEWVHHHRNPADVFPDGKFTVFLVFLTDSDHTGCHQRCYLCGTPDVGFGTGKENALDMEKVDRILEKEYKGITIELKEVNIHYKDGENVIHRGILLRMQVRSLQSLVRQAKERQH